MSAGVRYELAALRGVTMLDEEGNAIVDVFNLMDNTYWLDALWRQARVSFWAESSAVSGELEWTVPVLPGKLRHVFKFDGVIVSGYFQGIKNWRTK